MAARTTHGPWVAALVAVACALPATASAADYVVSPGRVDPPGMPVGSTNWTWRKLVSVWGPPEGCEFSVDCTSTDRDLATFPDGILVLKGSRITYIEVSGASWRTSRGARRGTSAGRLRAAYGRQLVAIRNTSQFAGRGTGAQRVDRTNYLVRSGRNAVGFSMASYRVSTILTGSYANERRAMSNYGPL